MKARRALIGVAVAGIVVARVALAGRPKPTHRPRVPVWDPARQTFPQPLGRPLLRVLLAPVIYALLGLWWPWDPIIHGVAKIWDAVKDKVAAVVESAVNMLLDLINPMRTLLRALYDSVVQGAKGVLSLTESIVRDVYATVRDWIDTAVGAVQAGVDWVAGEVRRVENLARDLANWAIGTLRSWVNDLLGWFNTYIVQPIKALAEGAYQFARHVVDDAIGWLQRYVIDPIIHRLEEAWHAAKVMWDWFTAFAYDTVVLAHKCWDFLLFVATHPLNWWYIILQQVFDRGSRWWINEVLRAVERHGDDVDRQVAAWIH